MIEQEGCQLTVQQSKETDTHVRADIKNRSDVVGTQVVDAVHICIDVESSLVRLS
jgi:hypothetical protein